MYFVDTHCHLNLDTFKDNVEQVVERALNTGVNKIVVPGIDINTSLKAVELASRFECIYAAVGTHPNEADKFDKQHIKVFEGLLKESKVVAVGEIGLDFHHHPENKVVQIELLEKMLALATQYDKPVILHSRNSLETLMEIIKNWNKNKLPDGKGYFGVFHGFEGSSKQALEIRSMQMTLGVGGPVTFKNAIDKQQLVKEFGVRDLVLETDAPLLSPHPFRGQTNEPFRIPLIAEKITDILEISLEEVSKITSQNAQYLYRWDEIN